MKKLFVYGMIFVLILAAGCKGNAADSPESSSGRSQGLYQKLLKGFTDKSSEGLYQYVDTESMPYDETAFERVFTDIFTLSGEYRRTRELLSDKQGDEDRYIFEVVYQNISIHIQTLIKGEQIIDLQTIYLHNREFELDLGENIKERRLQIKNDGKKIDGAFRYIEDGSPHPTIFLIQPDWRYELDLKGLSGNTKIFRDLSSSLAQRGINTYRMSTRFSNNVDRPDENTKEEEYFLRDFSKAIQYLKESESVGAIYLAFIAPDGTLVSQLAEMHKDGIDGLILINPIEMTDAGRAFIERTELPVYAILSGATVKNVDSAYWKSVDTDNGRIRWLMIEDMNTFLYTFDETDPVQLYRVHSIHEGPAEALKAYVRFNAAGN